MICGSTPESGYFVQEIIGMYNDHQGPVTTFTSEFSGPKKSLHLPPGWQKIVFDRLQDLDDTTETDAVKLEVRYFFRNSFGFQTKYRMIIRDTTNHIPWPPEKKMVHPSNGGIIPPILNARLLSSRPTSNVIDVTRRVEKYLGHNKDFNSVSIRPLDLFPYDDPDELRQNYCFLEVTDLWDKHVFAMHEYINN